MNGKIFNIQPFSIHDGPGIRTVVFMKGCNLRCYWCHNPESQDGRITMAYHQHKCIGCGECANVCPAEKEGRNALFTTDCMLCGRCAEACYAEAIEAFGEEITAEALTEKLKKDKSICSLEKCGKDSPLL